jgi:hypothetical protein
MDQAIIQPAVEVSNIVELRQYSMQPGGRDKLIGMFEDRFVAGQEDSGMRVLGQFRDARDPDRFVWMRGFRDMPSRANALQSFYGGPMWQKDSSEARATMVDASDVLLLKPIDGSDLTLTKRMTSLMVATVYLLNAPVNDEFVRFFNERVKPAMAATGAPPVATFRTEYAENNYPKLVVRNENAFVWFASYESAGEYDRHLARLWESKAWSAAQAELASRLKSPPQQLQLAPTEYTLKRNVEPYRFTMERNGSVNDFDFLPGNWHLDNRRLKKRGAGSREWDEFPSTSKGQVLMGGVVNVDENDFPTKGWSGVTFRHFDLEKKQWSIYWVNNRDGKMQPPVVGGFDGDIGLFYADDVDEGRPIKVVFQWTKLGPNTARWQQAFSYDDGKTWETNWMNVLTRTP